jgi:hypothetical protein
MEKGKTNKPIEMAYQLVHTNLEKVSRSRIIWWVAKRFPVPTKGIAPPSDLRIREVGKNVVRETVSDLRNDPQVSLDCLTDKPKAVTRRHLGPERAKRTLGLCEPVDFVFVVDEKVHKHLGKQRLEIGWPHDRHRPITRLSIVEKTRELEKHFA